jgi:hypothetical protein
MKKTLFRTFAVTAALALTAFAMTGHASADTNGYCRATCTSPNHGTTLASVGTTQSQCCSSSFNPCPSGYTPEGKAFVPVGAGHPILCL